MKDVHKSEVQKMKNKHDETISNSIKVKVKLLEQIEQMSKGK